MTKAGGGSKGLPMENLHVPHARQATSPRTGPAKLMIAADWHANQGVPAGRNPIPVCSPDKS
jgi:hypothetical protein